MKRVAFADAATPVLALAAHRALADDVVALLAERVPATVLNGILIQLTESEPAEDDLRLLLEQGVVTASLALGRRAPRDGFHLIGIRTDEPGRLMTRLCMQREAYRARMHICVIGSTVWLLLTEASRRWVTEMLCGPDMPPLLALGRNAEDLRLAPAHRRSLEKLLSVGQRRGWRGVADTARLEAATRVEALLDLAVQQPELLDGPLDALFDVPAHGALAKTMYAWFQHDQDAALTAAAMHVHVNTVRYRLRRAQDVTGIDLTDWDQRLLAQLQLRVWQATADVDETSHSPVHGGSVNRRGCRE